MMVAVVRPSGQGKYQNSEQLSHYLQHGGGGMMVREWEMSVLNILI